MHRRFAILLLLAFVLPALADGVDRYGDPLPGGAIARLGSIRFTHAASIDQFAFAADGKTIVFVGRDGVVGRWDANTGQELKRFSISPQTYPRGLLLSADGTLLVTSLANQGLVVWDTAAGKELRRVPGSAGLNPLLAWLKDGQSVLALDNMATVHLYDLFAGREQLRWPASTESASLV